MRKHKLGDDGAITIDEVLGQWVALIAIPKIWWLVLAAFIGFRVLDILKPDPVGWVESKFDGASGVILDDIVAGALVVAVLHALIFWFGLGRLTDASNHGVRYPLGRFSVFEVQVPVLASCVFLLYRTRRNGAWFRRSSPPRDRLGR